MEAKSQIENYLMKKYAHENGRDIQWFGAYATIMVDRITILGEQPTRVNAGIAHHLIKEAKNA